MKSFKYFGDHATMHGHAKECQQTGTEKGILPEGFDTETGSSGYNNLLCKQACHALVKIVYFLTLLPSSRGVIVTCLS